MVDKVKHIDMLEAIRRGNAEVKYGDVDGVLLHEKSGIFMLSTEDMELADRLTDWLEPTFLFVVHQEFGVNLMKAKYGYEPFLPPCNQAVYRGGKVELDGRYEVCLLTMEHSEAAKEHYQTESTDYLFELIETGKIYGAFVEGKLAGFVGEHSEGGIGLLEVFPEYRRRGIGEYLTGFMCNLHLDKGYTPFVQSFEENAVSRKLQQKAGFEGTSEKLWWLSLQVADK